MKMKFARIYPMYVAKAEKKGRTKEEVDQVICWLTGYSTEQIQQLIDQEIDIDRFITEAPAPNPNRELITGSVCGVKLAQIQDPMMKELRYLDKLIDELSKGKSMDKILRG